MARGELVEIRAAELRFTPDEAAVYLNEMMGLQLTARDVAALAARTEGWIAALQLAALSMQGRDDVAGFIAGFAGDDRYVVDHLVEEVLQRQPDRVQAFLLQTSVLDRLSGPLCDAVTGQGGGKAMLEALDRGNLFLVTLDDRRQWYRYHQLFADVLRARLLDERPGQVPDLHRRASAWHEQHGEQSVAIGHALAGEDFGRAADLVELAIPAMRRSRQEAALRGWLKTLPDEVVRVRPVLSVGLAGALLAVGEFEGVEGWLRSAERCLGATTGAGKGSQARRRRRPSATRSFAASRRGSSSTVPPWPWLAAMCPAPCGTRGGRSIFHLRKTTSHAATWHLMRSQELGEHTGLPQNRYRWRVAMARIREAEGDPAAALELLGEAERLYMGGFFPNVRPVPAVRARVWIAQGRLGEALGWAREQGLSVDDDLSYLREFEHITLARMFLARYKDEHDGRAGRAGQALIEPLSERELDVLRLLGSELDGPAIARELMVSLNTVRTHTKSIYAKLAVTNRRSAVRRAAELGLPRTRRQP
jgi:ATP/maltotriose-dependent transcriptional regulator MalT